MIEQRLHDRVALVTGGSSGIGREAALAFARVGASVMIASRGIERGEGVLREIETLGGRAAFVAADVSQADQVEDLVRSTVEEFGRLDYAFNNAGTLEVGMFKPTAEYSEGEFDQAIALNLKSVWLSMKHEIRQMLRQGTGGAIVNTSSVNGLGGVQQGALYAAAKAGVLGLTKSAALEYASQGIRVNALVGGSFDTPLLHSVFERMAGGDASVEEEIEGHMAGMVPLGRIGRPEEAARVVVWLCSDAASYVTGHSMIVDGGLTAAMR